MSDVKERRERVERSRTDLMAADSGPASTTTKNMENGMEQRSPKNTDQGKTTTTCRIIDNGKMQQPTKNADIGKETTTRRITDSSKSTSEPLPSTEKKFERALTLAVEIIGDEMVTMMELLSEVKKTCGVVNGCRFTTPKKYEITMDNVEGKDKLLDGIRIKKSTIIAKEIRNDELVVSFLNLPTYIVDRVILLKLAEWGVKAISPIKRRMWPGTDVADGTRFLKVRFTETVKSLPYSTKFETLVGGEYFRVIHDGQRKVCRLCIQPGHIFRECPEFRCHRCKEQGHYARECVPKAAEREDVDVEEEGNSTDSEKEETEESDDDDMQTEGDPGGVPESGVESKVQNQERQTRRDVAAGDVVETTGQEESRSGEESSGEKAPREKTPADGTGGIGVKQHGEGNRDERETAMDFMVIEDISEEESVTRPQKERKAEGTTKKRKAVLQAEEKRRKKEERRTK